MTATLLHTLTSTRGPLRGSPSARGVVYEAAASAGGGGAAARRRIAAQTTAAIWLLLAAAAAAAAAAAPLPLIVDTIPPITPPARSAPPARPQLLKQIEEKEMAPFYRATCEALGWEATAPLSQRRRSLVRPFLGHSRNLLS